MLTAGWCGLRAGATLRSPGSRRALLSSLLAVVAVDPVVCALRHVALAGSRWRVTADGAGAVVRALAPLGRGLFGERSAATGTQLKHEELQARRARMGQELAGEEAPQQAGAAGSGAGSLGICPTPAGWTGRDLAVWGAILGRRRQRACTRSLHRALPSGGTRLYTCVSRFCMPL